MARLPLTGMIAAISPATADGVMRVRQLCSFFYLIRLARLMNPA